MDQAIKAPQLDSPLGWLNTDRPLQMGRELQGQVVLLDFWTYCCMNCMHILPDLKYLEAKYATEPLVVIGVHSAKFPNESLRQTIRAAIHRYEIEHPVVIDDQMQIWRSYGARSWPTFVLIDPEGYLVTQMAGEGKRAALDEAIGRLLAHHRTKGTLADGPLDIKRDAAVQPASGLAFPGKVLVDPEGKRLFIADSNHNRIAVTSWPDEVGHCGLIKTIGSGVIGSDDGPAATATFNHPQGLALFGDTLYVADTENHTIRSVDLDTWSVTTVVGTGQMGYDHAGGGMGTQQIISSPWDLAMEGGTLYVAMAGINQIWRMEMPIGFARALAGTGRENIVDGPAETAALSQPSGICLHKGNIYFADSEVSAIRGVDLATEQVFTIIGQGLFVFGDVDGEHPKARLQHPLGVTSWGDKLLVADTYNHKIKIVDPETRSSTSLYGTGQPAATAPDGKLGLFEPGGLNATGDTLFIADTNNHRVVRVDLGTDAWAELSIDGLSAAATAKASPANVIQADPVAIASDADTHLSLDVALPDGAHLNPEAPWTAKVTSNGKVLAQVTGHNSSLPLVLNVPPHPDEKSGVWEISLSLVYCTDTSASVCVPAEVMWKLPVTREPGAHHEVSLTTLIGAGETV